MEDNSPSYLKLAIGTTQYDGSTGAECRVASASASISRDATWCRGRGSDGIVAGEGKR